jgi:hypothetical protein
MRLRSNSCVTVFVHQVTCLRVVVGGGCRRRRFRLDNVARRRHPPYDRSLFSEQATCLPAPITMQMLCAFASLRLCVQGFFT